MDAECAADEYCIAAMAGGICIAPCQNDADCGPNQICTCINYARQSDVTPIELGFCAPADCRTDADCSSGYLCMAPFDSGLGCPRGPSKFTCQTSEDECAGTPDCPLGDVCSASAPHRCQPGAACGRPFLVDGGARRAPSALHSNWLDRELVGAEPLELDGNSRDAVAEHWLDAAAMEHASVAAFARFALELMALGAPASLVEAATNAMADETCHARACYSLAARYSGRARGPGALDVRGALATVDLLAVVERAVIEGCLGETSAALEAAWALDSATDPCVRAVLARIAEDESRHAALAFEFVGWAALRDERVHDLVTALLADARDDFERGRSSRAAVADTSDALTAHGVLDPASRAEARRATLEDILPFVWSTAAVRGATPRPERRRDHGDGGW